MMIAPAITDADLIEAAIRIRRRHQAAPPPADDWEGWLAAVFPGYVRPPYATYHSEFWQWMWTIGIESGCRPFVAIWPRGFGKSTSTEIGVALCAARATRRYALYVCASQDQADKHVANVAQMLESPAFARHYPAAARRKIGKYGNSQGWRRNRLRAESGFTVDAIGLDTAARGAKVDEDRPDLIIFDDIDELLDSDLTVLKKLGLITKSILPARSANAAVLVAQNLIHRGGIVAQLATTQADFLADRIVSGPHPAIVEPEFEHSDGAWHLTAGTPTWDAMPIPALEATINAIGIKAFRTELQHEIEIVEGALWEQATIDESRRTAFPEGVAKTRVLIGVDPPGTAGGAECGIIAAIKGGDGRGYVVGDHSRKGSPNEWANAVVAAFDHWHADAVVIETNQGGDMAVNTLKMVRKTLPVIRVHASRGKATRAEPISALYSQGRVSHVGHFPALESQMTTWLPGMDSPDRLDASVWTLSSLLVTGSDAPNAPSAIPQQSTWQRGQATPWRRPEVRR